MAQPQLILNGLNDTADLTSPSVAGSISDVATMSVEAYLRSIREGEAAAALVLQAREDKLMQSKTRKEGWENDVIDVLAVSQVIKMFYTECESGILALVSETSLQKSITGNSGIANIALQSATTVLIRALEKLLKLLEEISNPGEAVKNAISLIKKVLDGKFTKESLKELLVCLGYCIDAVAPWPIKIAMKIAIVALKYAIEFL